MGAVGVDPHLRDLRRPVGHGRGEVAGGRGTEEVEDLGGEFHHLDPTGALPEHLSRRNTFEQDESG
jgi:hypothetical protein